MATKFSGSEEQERALDLQIKLFRATNSLRQKLSTFWDDHDLTESQFATLEALYHLGELNHKEIAEKMLTREANITHVVDNLERDGLVERCRSEEDRRVVDVCLTEEGRSVIAEAFPKFVEFLTDTVSDFDADKQETLAQLSGEFGRIVER
ncbi:MAG: MarR family winged helix-turn-helix transcriptional regulator [Halobacteriaceae archaeon]